MQARLRGHCEQAGRVLKEDVAIALENLVEHNA